MNKLLIPALLVITTSIFMLFVSMNRMKFNSHSDSIYRTIVNPQSLSFYTSDLAKEIFRISPFDDYIYIGSDKKHMADIQTFKRAYQQSNEVFQLIRRLLFDNKHIEWFVITDNSKIRYEIINKGGNGISVIRELEKSNLRPQFIGQSVVICNDCYVIDNNNRIFFSENYLSDRQIQFASSGHFMPVILSETLLPINISTLVIIDSNFNPKITLPIKPNQQILYDQKWQLIEIRSLLKPEENFVEQTIYFE